MLNNTFRTPNLEFCRQEAKQLLKALRSNEAGAGDLFRQHHPTNSNLDVSNVQLSDTQLIIARQHGFQSWAAMKSEAQLMRKRVAAAINAAIKEGAAPQEALNTLAVRSGLPPIGAVTTNKHGIAWQIASYGSPTRMKLSLLMRSHTCGLYLCTGVMACER